MTNIPESLIKGFEIDSVYLMSDAVTLSGSVGYLTAEVSDGTPTPATPDLTGNLTGFVELPISSRFDFTGRIDYRHQGRMFLKENSVGRVPPKNFINIRAGIQTDTWSLTAFIDNVTDAQHALDVSDFGPDIGVIRNFTKPGPVYGITWASRR